MRVEVHLQARERALAKGDLGQVRAIDADLRRVGYPVPSETGAVTMTTRKRARPRCEHGAVPDRCLECNPELETK